MLIGVKKLLVQTPEFLPQFFNLGTPKRGKKRRLYEQWGSELWIKFAVD